MLDLTITTGPHRGDVVSVRMAGPARGDDLALVGLPCTLVVAGGEPRVELDLD